MWREFGFSGAGGCVRCGVTDLGRLPTTRGDPFSLMGHGKGGFRVASLDAWLVGDIPVRFSNVTFTHPPLPIHALIGSLAVLVAACSGPRMEILDRPVASTKTSRALTNSTVSIDMCSLGEIGKQAMRQNPIICFQ